MGALSEAPCLGKDVFFLNRTENYQLCLWHESDRILMEDFNSDNRKIETALSSIAAKQTSESSRLDAAIASARSSLAAEDSRLNRVKSEFVTIASGINGTLANMTRTYNVSGWGNYSIVCLDIATPSGYNYTVKCNGQSGAFWFSGSPEYDKGISYLHGGVKARLIFFPMRSPEASVSCIQLCTLPGFGFISGLSYSALRTIEIAPEGAVAFGSAIPVTITAIK